MHFLLLKVVFYAIFTSSKTHNCYGYVKKSTKFRNYFMFIFMLQTYLYYLQHQVY